MKLNAKVIGTANVLSNLNFWQKIKFKKEIRSALKLTSKKIENDAIRMAPKDTGLLKASMWSKMVSDTEAQIGDGVYYGCVFGGYNIVHCGRGKQKAICQIKKGDKVMAQDGKLHKVIETSRYYATEKPNLVELKYPNRKNRDHKLILTQDHKVIVNRNGCNFWIKAGKLKQGDLVYTLYKKNFNNIKKERIIRKCLLCGKKFKVLESVLKYNSSKYCSEKCRKESRSTNLNPHIGMKRSKETRELMSNITTKRLKERPETHPNRILAKKGFKSSHEKEIEKFLKINKIKFEFQKQIGKYFVDFYLKKQKIIIEADGGFWHKNQDKDIERDKNLLSLISKDWLILHIHFTDKRKAKKVKFNPLKNVYYIQCNPSMESFVNLKRFKLVKIKNVKKFKYKNNSKNLGHKGTQLYDLTIKDIHSFVVKGLLVSNSFQELGTARFPAQPFLMPAFEANKKEFEGYMKKVMNN